MNGAGPELRFDTRDGEHRQGAVGNLYAGTLKNQKGPDTPLMIRPFVGRLFARAAD